MPAMICLKSVLHGKKLYLCMYTGLCKNICTDSAAWPSGMMPGFLFPMPIPTPDYPPPEGGDAPAEAPGGPDEAPAPGALSFLIGCCCAQHLCAVTAEENPVMQPLQEIQVLDEDCPEFWEV